MRVVNEVETKTWMSFVREHSCGNIFHTPEMYQVFNLTQGYQPSLWAVEKPNGALSALFLPVQVSLSGALKGLTTRAIAYGSLLFAEDQEGWEAVDLLLRTYKHEVEHPPLFTELRNLSDLSSVQRILTAQGFIFEQHLNYLIDISQPVDEIFKRIGRRTRKNIRRGLNRNLVEVNEITEYSEVQGCIDLIQKTYRNARIPLAHPSLFENAYNILSPAGMIRYTQASVEGAPAAASIELLFKDIVYGWYGGLDRRYSAYIPNELLMWNILKWGAEKGFQVYDFGGAGKPDEKYGVRDFKAKFGGDLVCYGRNTYVHRPGLLRLSKAGYRAYQSVKSLGN